MVLSRAEPTNMPGEYADGEGGDAELAVEEDGAEDDSGVVDERGEGLVGKILRTWRRELITLPMKRKSCAGRMRRVMVVQSAALRGSSRKPLLARRTYSGAKISARRTPTPEDDEHGGEDDGECAVAALFVAGFAVAVEDGDEGDGGCSADEEVGEEVGEFEGGAVGVLGDAGAEEEVDVFDADEGEDSREDGREHEEEGGGVGAVGGGGFEEG